MVSEEEITKIERILNVNQEITQISKTLQSAYDEQYTDKMTEWREIGGKYKAANILNVCKNHEFSKVLECGAGEGSILKFLDESGSDSFFPKKHWGFGKPLPAVLQLPVL